MFFNFFKKVRKRKGFADGGLLVQILIYCMIAGIITTSFVTLQSSNFSSLAASRVELEAQQWADIEANTIRATGYDSVQNQPRKIIAGSENTWENEVIVGPEQTITPDSKQKIVTVKIYKTGESIEKFALKVPLSSQGTGGGVPIGSIIAWPLASEPQGADKNKWLECNGQAVDASKYPKLAALMSNTPDYQGVFLRGLGSQYSYHYNVVLHQSAALGELQGDTIRNITGQIGSYGCGSFNRLDALSGAFSKSYGTSNYGSSGTGSNQNIIFIFDSSSVVPVASENRPINRSVRYLIRAA